MTAQMPTVAAGYSPDLRRRTRPRHTTRPRRARRQQEPSASELPLSRASRVLSFLAMGPGTRSRAPGRSGRLAPLSAADPVITTRDGSQDSPKAHSTAHRNLAAAEAPVTTAARKLADVQCATEQPGYSPEGRPGRPEHGQEMVRAFGPRQLVRACANQQRSRSSERPVRGRGDTVTAPAESPTITAALRSQRMATND
jgi:hypothetical protein